MVRRVVPLLFLLILVLALWLPLQITPGGYTRIDLTGGDGRPILSVVLADGETGTFSWKNSLFGLQVEETFSAQDGIIVQTGASFFDPLDPPPPRISAREADDYYHTGEPFRAEGLSRPFTKIVYRVGEIGNPQMRIGGITVDLKREEGFGGRIVLTTGRPNFYEILLKEKRS